MERVDFTAEYCLEPRLLDKLSRVFRRIACQQMAHCGLKRGPSFDVPVREKPFGGAPVQSRQRCRLLSPRQLGAHQLGEERMVPIPGARVIQRCEEQATLLQILQQALRFSASELPAVAGPHRCA